MGELDGEKENEEAEACALPSYVATRMASLLNCFFLGGGFNRAPFRTANMLLAGGLSLAQYEWNGVVGHVKAELSHVLRVPCV